MRKIMVWLGLALLFYFIVFRPDAGQTFVNLRHAIVDIAESLGRLLVP